MLRAECKNDNTRNSMIREGLLFIKANTNSIIITKLEKLTVIDKEIYKIKSELGKEKDLQSITYLTIKNLINQICLTS